MTKIIRVGVDLAKNVIQVHAVDAAGKVVTSRLLKREKFLLWCAELPAGCLVAMEACGGAHHWCRKLRERGLDARMIAAALVAPYRIQGKSGKNDANDAAAVCEAASRPHMNFVPPKTLAQQGMLCVHRLREGLKQERVACINRIRGLLAERRRAGPASSRAQRYRPDHRLSRCGHGGGLQAVQECSSVRCLAGADTETKFQRRQVQSGRHHQTRQ